MTLRIAFGRINQESHALSPIPTEWKHFQTVWKEGADLLRVCSSSILEEVPGYARNAELTGMVRACKRMGIEALPMFSAWSLPGAALTRECFDQLVDRLVKDLRAHGRLDGVFLALHGQLAVQGVDDPELNILKAVRSVVGNEIPIGATFDLHGNPSRERLKELAVHVVYRTNPHRDFAEVGELATTLLAKVIRKELHPTTAVRRLPIILGGGTTLDFLEPMKSLQRVFRKSEVNPKVITTNLFTVHPFGAGRTAGWTVTVTTDGDQELAERLCDELADAAWQMKHHPPPTFLTIDDSLKMLKKRRLRSRLGTHAMVDTSDTVTAGAPGENTYVLEELWNKADGYRVYVPLHDTETAQALAHTPLGTRVSLSIGGKRDQVTYRPLPVTGILKARVTGNDFGIRVRLDLDVKPGGGNVSVVISENNALAISPTFFSPLGLRPMDAHITVVKTYFPFLVFYAPYLRGVFAVKTKGICDFEAAFPLLGPSPTHPRDVVHDWREFDALDRERHLAQGS